jgi:hypothetical protein
VDFDKKKATVTYDAKATKADEIVARLTKVEKYSGSKVESNKISAN